MRITYRHIPPQTVLCARSMGPYASSVPQAWAKLNGWLDRHDLRPRVKQAYGIFRDDPSKTDPSLLRFEACIPMLPGVEFDPAEGVTTQLLRFGAYAVYTHVGAHQDAAGLFSQLREEIVPRRGLLVEHDRPFLAIHLNDPATTRAAYLRTELCVPVLPIRMPLAGNDDADVAATAAGDTQVAGQRA